MDEGGGISTRRLSGAIVVMGLALTLLVWGGLSMMQSHLRATAHKDAYDHAMNLAKSFEENAVRVLRTFEQAMAFVAAEYVRDPRGFSFDAPVLRSLALKDIAVQVAITDAQGILTHSNLGLVRNAIDLSDREHIRVQRDDPTRGLFISKPVLGRNSGKWSIQLSRAMTDADGRLIGVLVASVDPNYFSEFYESVSLGERGEATLIGLDGVLRARSGHDPSVLGHDFFKDDGAFSKALNEGPEVRFRALSPMDGVERLYAQRHMTEYPLTVTVGFSAKDVFASVEAASQTQVQVALVATLVFWGAIAMLLNALRTREVAERALYASRQDALRANRAKSDFLATMSHEIRTPLNGLLGMASLLEARQSPDADPKDKEYLRTIRHSGEALLRILNDILDLSKLEAGKIDVIEADFDLESLVQDVMELARPVAQRKDIVLAVTIGPGLPKRLRGDPGRLRQILNNLLGNAVKFTREGEIAVTIEMASQTPLVVKFAVEDTGIGIAPERAARLFENYEQGDPGIARNYGGTGLGLAISKRLVERLGGQIGYESRERGSRFWFTLPFAPAQAKVAASAPAVSVPPMRILLVEDNPVNQRVFEGMLKLLGHSVQSVGDGLQALILLRTARFDLIFMDLHMPGIDGFEAARQIRALPNAMARVPIVAASADILSGQIEDLRAAGINDFLPKPFRKSDLESVLAKWGRKEEAA